MTNAKPSPVGEGWGTAKIELDMVERSIAGILLRFIDNVNTVNARDFVRDEAVDFLSRIVAENRIDPESGYKCDICGHYCKGRDGRELDCGVFVCRWCKIREDENSTEGGR